MNLHKLGFDNYTQYLRSDLWLSFRQKYRDSDRPQTCMVCGRADVALHHLTYARVGCEQLTDVVPLCNGHHEAVHKWIKRTKGKSVYDTCEAVSLFTGVLHEFRPELTEQQIKRRRQREDKATLKQARKEAKKEAKRKKNHRKTPVLCGCGNHRQDKLPACMQCLVACYLEHGNPAGR